MWEIVQIPEFSDWFDSLDEDAREDILSSVLVLENIGPILGRPRVDTIKGSKIKNLKELRVQSNGRPFRILFFFDPYKRAILLIGGNKQNDKLFYEKKIAEAEKLYKKYFS